MLIYRRRAQSCAEICVVGKIKQICSDKHNQPGSGLIICLKPTGIHLSRAFIGLKVDVQLFGRDSKQILSTPELRRSSDALA